MSRIVLPNGETTHKLDFLGTVRIYGKRYFSIYRRYNHKKQFIFKDFSGEIYVCVDTSIRKTIQTILCLTKEQMKGLYVDDAWSFRDNDDVSEHIDVSMRWSDIQENWFALHLNMGGICHEFHNVKPFESSITITPYPNEYLQHPVPRNEEEFLEDYEEHNGWVNQLVEEPRMMLRSGRRV